MRLPHLLAVLVALALLGNAVAAGPNAKPKAKAKKPAAAKQERAGAAVKQLQTELADLKAALADSQQEQAKLQDAVDALRKEVRDLRDMRKKAPGKKKKAPANVDDDDRVSIYYLKSVIAADVATRLGGLLEDAKIVADPRLNALVISADPDQQLVIEALLRELDSDGKKK